MSRHKQQPQFVRDLFTAASKFAKTVRDINSALIRTLPGLIFIQGTYETLSCRAGELWAGDFYLFSSSLIVCRCFSFSFLCYTLKIRREYRADMVRDGIRCCSVGRSSILVVHFLLLVGKSFGHYSRLLQEQNDMLLLTFFFKFFAVLLYQCSIWFWVMCFCVTCIGWLLITGLQMSQSCWGKPRAETHLSPSAVSSQEQPRCRHGGRYAGAT